MGNNKIIAPPPLFATLDFTKERGAEVARVLNVAKTFKLNAFAVPNAYVLQTWFCSN